ncbi:hypothetical protein [uncultured Jannaschia sp.]|nr:hypothetical protein [uncultured Jannaschia sp.]
MRKLIKTVAVLGITATLVACGAPAEEEIVFVEPVTVDPVSTKF